MALIFAVLFATLVFASVGCVSGATAPEEEWDRTFGGPSDDFARSVQQTSDGGYILAGSTESYGAGEFDFWLVKVDSNGNPQWDKTFGGTDGEDGALVQQTSDGGYILAGNTLSYGAGKYDIWLIKTDSTGNKQWDKTFGGTGAETVSSVQQTSDGGYILAGRTTSYGAGYHDVWLIKTDSNGEKLWDKTFGGTDYDDGRSVQQTSDGGYILAGLTESYGAGDGDAWLIKADSNGEKLWDKTFGGPGIDWVKPVQQTSDGGYIMAGSTFSYSNTDDGDVWLIKTDSNGNKQWDKTFGGTNFDFARSVQQTSDGGYILLGESEYDAYDDDIWLIKTDSNGNMQWDKIYGGDEWDWTSAVQQTSDGGYILAGSTESYGAGEFDFWLIKIEGKQKEPSVSVPGFEAIFAIVSLLVVVFGLRRWKNE